MTGYRITATPGGATVTVEGAATSGSVYGLTNGTPYTFTVVAINAEGDGPASAAPAGIVPKEATAPSAVQDLQVSAGNARATVIWKAPADDGGADIRRTLVRIYESADDSYVGYVSATAPATDVEIANLVVGTAYYVKVYTENRSYYTGSTVQSEDFTPHAGPEPAPPASATAEAGTGRATVGWEPPVEDGGSPVTGYVVIAYDSSDEAVGAPVTVTQDKTTASVTGLTNGSWYYFGVAATNADGTGPETYTVRVRPATAPGAPTDITGFPQNRAAFVVWKEPGDDGGSPVTSYTVTAKGPDGTEHKTVSGAECPVLRPRQRLLVHLHGHCRERRDQRSPLRHLRFCEAVRLPGTPRGRGRTRPRTLADRAGHQVRRGAVHAHHLRERPIRLLLREPGRRDTGRRLLVLRAARLVPVRHQYR
ncbi:fibronectin type III domain-containing protein [Streptomyces tendae]